MSMAERCLLFQQAHLACLLVLEVLKETPFNCLVHQGGIVCADSLFHNHIRSLSTSPGAGCVSNELQKDVNMNSSVPPRWKVRSHRNLTGVLAAGSSSRSHPAVVNFKRASSRKRGMVLVEPSESLAKV